VHCYTSRPISHNYFAPITQEQTKLSELSLLGGTFCPNGDHLYRLWQHSLSRTDCVTLEFIMSGPFDPTANVSLPDMMDQGFPMYDNHYNSYPRLAGPTSHFDGVAFWYRPNNTEPVYERESSGYNQGIALPANTMEASSVKHRRTRSGCFTCRSRRVKVGGLVR
jgi:hypothetical protein